MNSHESKAGVEEIRARFDKDVERFSNLETGQTATVDAPLTLDLIAAAARELQPRATALLDIGCGAGNFSLKLMDAIPTLADFTLVDLSRPMLTRAQERIAAARPSRITPLQTDIREASFAPESFDLVVAAATLHHLRADAEWRAVFSAVHRALRPGGVFLISDLITHSIPAVHTLLWARYGEYLSALKGPAYREHVLAYIAYEDTPRPLLFQLDLLREIGFRGLDILHKNSCFAAFLALK